MPKPDKTPVKQSNDMNHQAIKGLAKTRVGVLFRSDSGEEFFSETGYTLLTRTFVHLIDFTSFTFRGTHYGNSISV